MDKMPRIPTSLDIIVPFYNEGETIHHFYERLCQVVEKFSFPTHFYFINDGSHDKTQDLLLEIAQSDDRITIIELSRNFGHQAALTAGLDMAFSDVVVTMDGDGQHPAELILDMLDLYKAGYDIVNTQRVDDDRISIFKKLTAELFYWFINQVGETRIVPRSADFRLMSQTVVREIRCMREHHRFLRGLVAWMGYPSIILPFEPAKRFAGETKYSVQKMIQLALDAIFSFSLIPLRVGILVGVIFLLLAFLEMAYVLSFWFTARESLLAPGWSSLMFVILITGGSIMILLGIVGLYIGYIFQEVKQRPIYLIKSKTATSTNEKKDV